jgi:hypothetical protein
MKQRSLLRATCFVLFIGIAMIVPTALASTFELVAASPTIKTYQLDTDYELFVGPPLGNYPSAPGDVTARLEYVGFGLEANDFTSFHSGNIALISRGAPAGWLLDSYFSTKVNNAYSYGAIGAIVFDNFIYPLQPVTLTVDTSIPSIFVSYTVAPELLGYLQSGITTAHINTTNVPEPSALPLLGFGLLGIASVRRIRK